MNQWISTHLNVQMYHRVPADKICPGLGWQHGFTSHATRTFMKCLLHSNWELSNGKPVHLQRDEKLITVQFVVPNVLVCDYKPLICAPQTTMHPCGDCKCTGLH
eukprot:TRINITY_DN67724_c6_g2_i1.p6 TRINITY_DN67724_c6_g2~~TRINITY_DN67724_c6_g2_i1.p6  ORF type:complete len:104 (-),score=6.75 TRINITY_DN67724_c6_g2_i1:208-519(-)